MAQDLDKDRLGRNILIKLDLEKAYDKLSWSFLLAVCRGFGLNERVCDIIFRLISNSWYSVCWKGVDYGFFKSYRGVRQGDPLSPSLFVIALDWLSRRIDLALVEGHMKQFVSSRNAIQISHLMYADDIIICCAADTTGITKLREIIDTFCGASGQSISEEKSYIFFSSLASLEFKEEMMRITRFSEGSFPCKYLGAPLFSGKVRAEYFDGLVAKFARRVWDWSRKLLSMAGRRTLIQSVLGSITTHVLSVLPVPASINKQLKTLIINYLWGESRHHWVNMKLVFSPTTVGGLGIRSLVDVGKH